MREPEAEGSGPDPVGRCCRVCGLPCFSEPLLSYGGMPKAAQHLPEAASLAEDQGVDLEVLQCSGCGLVQLANEPVPYFKEVIRAVGFSEEMKAFRRDQFGRFIRDQDLQGRKILEVGCGRGEYLSLLQELDVQATGVESSGYSVRSAREQGLDVHQGFLEADGPVLPSAPFDAFLMFSFLEHLPDPNGTLRCIHANLGPDAVGLLEVPNFDMILTRNMFAEFIGDHLLYFTRDTLIATLARNGFVTLRCEEAWHGYILSATVRRRPRLDLAHFHGERNQLKAALDDFIDQFPPGQVAAWGAGHQAFTVLALAGLGDRIRYVVDSAPFKQGRFTPATHLPIVAPDRLESDPVQGIIVMAASYSDEVAKNLLRDYPGRFRICILKDHGVERVDGVSQPTAFPKR